MGKQPHISDFKLGYRPALDGLRGISILLVLEHHAPWHVARMDLLPGGFLGVDIFFVLSGFLITTLLVQERNQSKAINLKNFYVRRVLRLFPALFLLVIFSGLYAFFLFRTTGKPTAYVTNILPAVFYSTNWFIALNLNNHMGPLVITWSLAIEEQFYIFWPPAISFALRHSFGHRRTIISLIVFIVAISLGRAWMTLSGVSATRMYYGTDTRADSLLIGCLLGLILMWIPIPRGRRSQRTIKVLAVMSILTLTLFEFTLTHAGRVLYLFGFTIISVSAALILLMIFCAPIGLVMSILNNRALVWIGRISYGLYLWHWPVRSMLIRLTPNGSLGTEVAYLSLSFLVATLSFYFLERPFLRLKKSFTARARSGSAIPEGA